MEEKQIFQDPEIMALLSQPGVGEALQDIMSNPAAGMAKYANNPAVMAAFNKIQAKMGSVAQGVCGCL